jgi:hypothetical protein
VPLNFFSNPQKTFNIILLMAWQTLLTPSGFQSALATFQCSRSCNSSNSVYTLHLLSHGVWLSTIQHYLGHFPLLLEYVYVCHVFSWPAGLKGTVAKHLHPLSLFINLPHFGPCFTYCFSFKFCFNSSSYSSSNLVQHHRPLQGTKFCCRP